MSRLVLKCVGCSTTIQVSVEGTLSFTCSCGSTMFVNGETLVPPASFINLEKVDDIPHIDYYLGKSNRWSEEKNTIYKYLRSKGAIWSWECEECKDRTIERAEMELRFHLYPYPLHLELLALVNPSYRTIKL